jgi:hypothetical protein
MRKVLLPVSILAGLIAYRRCSKHTPGAAVRDSTGKPSGIASAMQPRPAPTGPIFQARGGSISAP